MERIWALPSAWISSGFELNGENELTVERTGEVDVQQAGGGREKGKVDDDRKRNISSCVIDYQFKGNVGPRSAEDALLIRAPRALKVEVA